MTSKAVMFGTLCIALVAGCSATRSPPPLLLARVEPLLIDPLLARPKQIGPVAITPLAAAEIIAAPTVLAPSDATPITPASPDERATGNRPVTAAPAASFGPIVPAGTVGALSPVIPLAARTRLQPGAVPAKASTPAVALDAFPNGEKPVPVAGKLEPTLDVAALKERLRNTSSIGMFTKLALKNQVDDLLTQFRTYHSGGGKSSITSLREPYNTLVGKVLSLIEEGDPSLAHTISGSREAIWSILADPEKFKTAT